MAYLAVNKDGTEAIFSTCPFRARTEKTEYSQALINKEQCEGYWYLPVRGFFDNGSIDYYGETVEIPRGTIERIIGHPLTFEDEPEFIDFIDYEEIKVGDWVETCAMLPGIVTEVNGDDIMVFIPGKHTIVNKCGGCHSIKCCGVHKIDGDYARKLFAIGEEKLEELWNENNGKLPWDEFINEYWRKNYE